jgi:hypothetical protein
MMVSRRQQVTLILTDEIVPVDVAIYSGQVGRMLNETDGRVGNLKTDCRKAIASQMSHEGQSIKEICETQVEYRRTTGEWNVYAAWIRSRYAHMLAMIELEWN